MPRHPVAIALTVLAAAACSPSIPVLEKDVEAARMQSEALAMRRATEKAQATLGDFLIKAKELPPGTKDYAVKVGVREGRNTEYFWVNEFTWSDSEFTGRINDEPRLVKRVKPGQMHTFSRSDVVDWTYVDESGRTVGNFTACALASKQPPGEVGEFNRRKDLGCS